MDARPSMAPPATVRVRLAVLACALACALPALARAQDAPQQLPEPRIPATLDDAGPEHAALLGRLMLEAAAYARREGFAESGYRIPDLLQRISLDTATHAPADGPLAAK